MATHSSILPWEIPWTKKPVELQSMGLQRVGHDLETKQQHGNTVIPRSGGVGSRTPPNTKIHKCSSPLQKMTQYSHLWLVESKHGEPADVGLNLMFLSSLSYFFFQFQNANLVTSNSSISSPQGSVLQKISSTSFLIFCGEATFKLSIKKLTAVVCQPVSLQM